MQSLFIRGNGISDAWRADDRDFADISGVTTRGEVRQLPQGAKRQGRFWSTDCLLCTTEFSRISKERKKLKNKQNEGTLCIYIHLDIGSV